jgi:hypothetical protein
MYLILGGPDFSLGQAELAEVRLRYKNLVQS